MVDWNLVFHSKAAMSTARDHRMRFSVMVRMCGSRLWVRDRMGRVLEGVRVFWVGY